jgi:Prokaryotic membrane lipoprotein lipid attachment site
MKKYSSLIALGSVFVLAGCESSNVARTSDVREFQVSGIQGQATVVIPADQPVSSDAPYAIRGSGQKSDANSADRARQGTNHM